LNLRRADIRFALPDPARRAIVVGLPEWREALTLAGVDVVAAEDGIDLAVAPASRAREITTRGARMVVLEGRAVPLSLRSGGYRAHRYLPLPDIAAPDLVLPLARSAPARYALQRWRPADTGLKRARNAAVAGLVHAGAFPPVRPLQIAGVRSAGPPFLVRAAQPLGVPQDVDWFLTLGQGDALTRAVFHLFRAGSPDPEWILKFARVRGHDEPFRRDERGLSLARAAGDAVARHAPALLGRSECDGLAFSVETAAVGERLSTLLRRPTPEIAKIAAIERVAAWLLEVAQSTARPPVALEAELERLDGVVARWAPQGAERDLVRRLGPVSGTLQHNDPGSWNIVMDEKGFTVVDWESARETGLPLWDLLYFLVDALPLVEGADTVEERAEGALALLRGERSSSSLLFEWVRRGAAATNVPADSVGVIATLCWLHHGLSHTERERASERTQVDGPSVVPPVERIAAAWLADPALGPGWNRWLA